MDVSLIGIIQFTIHLIASSKRQKSCLQVNSCLPFPLDKKPKYISAKQKASNESTCAKLIGIEDKDQYPICPKPYIYDIQNRVSDPNGSLFFQ